METATVFSPSTDSRVAFKLGLGYVVGMPMPSLVLGLSCWLELLAWSWTCVIMMSLSGNQSLVCAWPRLLSPDLPCLPCSGPGGWHPLKDSIPQLPPCCPLSSPLLQFLETDQVAKEPLSQPFSWRAYCRIALHCQKGKQSRTINSFYTLGMCMNQWKTTAGCNSIGLKIPKQNETPQGVVLETEDKKSISLK